jgi:endonuclease G
MRPATLIATLALAAALPGVAAAAPSACPEHHPGGLAPDILRPTLAERARELCFRGYAVLHSGVSWTALAAAEHLTRERVQAARGLERENAFHAEERLPLEERGVPGRLRPLRS